MFFADFTDTKTLIALFIAACGVALLFLAKKIAGRLLQDKFDDKESEQYKEKLFNLTLTIKAIAAGITVVGCVISLM